MKEHSEFDNAGLEGLPIADAQDNLILMHRDIHFGGKFDVMVDYYVNEGKGVHPDFDLERIVTLAKIEKEMKTDLAPLMLSGVDAEKIAEAKDAYKKLREVYNLKNKNMRLIADLILTEELDPRDEINAIVEEKETIVPALITLLKTEEYYDSLYPGYGMAPSLAAKCLGIIGDKRAIIALFESMGEGDFFDEDMALEALRQIGEPAKEFLLRVLQAKPINEDNLKAAVAIIAFKDDENVSKACLEMLKSKEIFKNIPLATYLILACTGLRNKTDRHAFQTIANDAETPKMFTLDMKSVMSEWS